MPARNHRCVLSERQRIARKVLDLQMQQRNIIHEVAVDNTEIKSLRLLIDGA